MRTIIDLNLPVGERRQLNGRNHRLLPVQPRGNHAQALALAARENGIPAHIVMQNSVRLSKAEATRGYGANVILCEQVEREAVTVKIVAETGARLVHPFEHPDVILGQGTMGLELQEQVLNLDAIITGCTGIKVYGAEPEFEGADDGRQGYYSGERVTQVKTRTIADGLRAVVGERPRDIIYRQKLVSGMYAVSEDEIREATRLVLERLKIWIEHSAAVPLAVALYNEEFRAMVEKEAGEDSWDISIVLSGGNINIDGLVELFSLRGK
ncbi:pyridoxal-phosphate dependent [Fusarium oxysporum f. sp. phaseoli]